MFFVNRTRSHFRFNSSNLYLEFNMFSHSFTVKYYWLVIIGFPPQKTKLTKTYVRLFAEFSSYYFNKEQLFMPLLYSPLLSPLTDKLRICFWTLSHGSLKGIIVILFIYLFLLSNKYKTLSCFFVGALLSCLASPMDYWLCTTFRSSLWVTLSAQNKVQQFSLIIPTALSKGVHPS